MTALRAAVIGAGAMGRHHARVYHDLDETELVGVADHDWRATEFVARRFGTRVFSNYEELLHETQPDIVSVVVPTRLHLAVARDCMLAGAHVLVEKPIAATVVEACEMIEVANGTHRRLSVGHVERFNPAILELKRRLDRGELGKAFMLHARRLGPFPERVRDVGVIVDLATHDLDVMQMLVGSPVTRVYAETARRIHTDHEDLLTGMIRFSTGEIGTLTVNWLTPTKVRELAVTGERGMFVVNYLTQQLRFFENRQADNEWESYGILQGVGEGHMTQLRIERHEPLAAQLAAFAHAVNADSSPVVSGEDGRRALELALALVMSGLENEVVAVPS